MKSSEEQQGEIRKPLLAISAKKKKKRKKTEWERLKISSRNYRYQGNIPCKDAHNKQQKQYGPNRSKRY